MTDRAVQLLAFFLSLALPAAPALCRGLGPDFQPEVPTCHHDLVPSPAGTDDAPADTQEDPCCPACDGYLSAKVLEDAPQPGSVAWLPPAWEVPGLSEPFGFGASARPPPGPCACPYARSNPPLRI